MIPGFPWGFLSSDYHPPQGGFFVRQPWRCSDTRVKEAVGMLYFLIGQGLVVDQSGVHRVGESHLD